MFKQRFFWLLLPVLLALLFGVYSLYPGQKAAWPEKRQSTAKEERELVKGEESKGEGVAEVELQYLGHAAFLLQVGGVRFLMDPYDPNCGYGKLELEADYLTISHEHMDHNYRGAAPGARAIRGLSPDGLGWEEVSLTLSGVELFTLPCYHDAAAGKLRGRNAVFVFDAGGIRLVHLGDLGHLLGPEQIEKLIPVDVLLLPVGGHFTLNAGEGKELVEALQPAVVVPMHYRTEATRNWPIAPLHDFLEVWGKGHRDKGSAVTISRDTLPRETEIWVMQRAPQRKS